MIEQLVGRTFATRDAVHLLHFRTDSYAQHEALGALYTALVDKVDEIVEVYQGAKGLINEVPTISRPPLNMITAHLASEAEWIRANRSKISTGVPAIENLLDELCASYLRTVYKLRHLK